MDHNQERRRGHVHRGRRGSDRRGPDRRTPQAQVQERPGRDQVDVEQIMRDIRGRIAQRQGIDLSNQQIQDLAARRLESILDPRAIKPSLLDGLRRSAAAPGARSADKVPNEPAFTFEDTTIYDSHRGALRFMRRLLNPLLKLFFNPNPLIRALHLQARLNVEAAERDAERDRRQTEWNALHYEIVQRLVTDVSRASLELQALSMRIESLDAKVEFNERRVRSIEGSAHRSRPQGPPQARPAELAAPSPGPSPGLESETTPAEPTPVPVDGQTPEVARRRRRRRRGRRTGVTPGETAPIAAYAHPGAAPVPSDTHMEPPPADSRVAEADAEAVSAPFERAMEAPQQPPPQPPPQAPPQPLEFTPHSSPPPSPSLSPPPPPSLSPPPSPSLSPPPSPSLSPPEAPDERAAPGPLADHADVDPTER